MNKLWRLITVFCFIFGINTTAQATSSSSELNPIEKSRVIAFLPLISKDNETPAWLSEMLTEVFRYQFSEFQLTDIPTHEAITRALDIAEIKLPKSFSDKQLSRFFRVISADYLVSGALQLKETDIYFWFKITNINDLEKKQNLTLHGSLDTLSLLVQEAVAQIAQACHLPLFKKDKEAMLSPGDYNFASLKSLHDAVHLFEQYKYIEALEVIDALLQEHPRFDLATWAACNALKKQKRWHEVKRRLEIALTGGSLPLKIFLGEIYLEEREMNLAKEQFDSLQMTYPGKSAIYFYLGKIYAQKKLFELALEYFEKGAKHSFQKQALYNEIAEIYLAQEQFEKAREVIQEALTLDPENPKSLQLQGMLLALTGDYEKALTQYQKAIQFKKEMALDQPSQEQYPTPHTQKEIQESLQLIKDEPNNVTYYNDLASLYEQQGELEKAASLYTQAIQINPNFAPAYFNLAFNFSQQGKIDLAVQNYQKSLVLNPKHVASYLNLGDLYWKSKNVKLAFQTWEKGLAWLPDNRTLLEKTADRYAQINKWDKMIAAYEKIEEVFGEKGGAPFWIGQCFMRHNEPKKAYAYFQQSLKTIPDSPLPYRELAKYYDKHTQKIENAIKYYELYLSKELNLSKTELIKQRVQFLKQELAKK